MNINKHDPETDMEMDMTPMIDVVFLLIIFFMIITDMSQADLEELKLPVAENADPDKPPPGTVRPVLNIKQAGTILAKRDVIFDPENSDEYKKLQTYLYSQASAMPKEPIDKNKPGVDMIPGGNLLIRADQNTPFKYIQKVMGICGLEKIKLWKLQLAAAETAEKQAGGAAPTEE